MSAIAATYDYRDEKRSLLFQVCRFKPKDFRVRRPDSNGGWIWGLSASWYDEQGNKIQDAEDRNARPNPSARWFDECRRVPYGLPELLAADSAKPVFVLEGEKDKDNAQSLDLISTTNPGGAGKWHDEYSEFLQGRHVVIIPDNDDKGRDHAHQVANSLADKAASVRILLLPSLPSKGDLTDWINTGGTANELLRLASTAPRIFPLPSFEEVEQVFHQWLLIADPGYVRVFVAAVVANKLEGDPFWLFIVASPGGTKTELIRTLSDLPEVYSLSDLTEQTFISGDRSNKKASLLLRLPERAVLVMKDFTTVLSMHRDKRAVILSQLREIYDGYYSKEFGTGERVEWQGKVGFIAGVTSIVDRHHAVYAVLGERFLQYRPIKPHRKSVAKKAMENDGKEAPMREELRKVLEAYFRGLVIPETPPSLPSEWTERIAGLACLCASARTGVPREGYSSREIEIMPDPEMPTRIAKQLRKVTTALAVVRDGVYTEDDYALVWKIGMDSIPKSRRDALEYLARSEGQKATPDIAADLDYPTNTIRRVLEDLAALQLLKRSKPTNNINLWELTEETQSTVTEIRPKTHPSDTSGTSIPEMSSASPANARNDVGSPNMVEGTPFENTADLFSPRGGRNDV